MCSELVTALHDVDYVSRVSSELSATMFVSSSWVHKIRKFFVIARLAFLGFVKNKESLRPNQKPNMARQRCNNLGRFQPCLSFPNKCRVAHFLDIRIQEAPSLRISSDIGKIDNFDTAIINHGRLYSLKLRYISELLDQYRIDT